MTPQIYFILQNYLSKYVRPNLENVLIFPQFFWQITTMEDVGKRGVCCVVRRTGMCAHTWRGEYKHWAMWWGGVITVSSTRHIMSDHVLQGNITLSHSAGPHTLIWWMRDTGTRGTTYKPFTFSSQISAWGTLGCTHCSNTRSIAKLNAKERSEYFFANSQRLIFILCTIIDADKNLEDFNWGHLMGFLGKLSQL